LTCLKDILRSIADQINPDEALVHVVPAGKFTRERCKELIEARNLNRVVDMIDDEGLKRALAPKLSADRSAISLVSAIDQYHYARLWNAANIPDPLDSQSAKRLIGEFIDHLNILLAFRARLIGLDARSALELTIPINYALGNTLNELAESANVQNLMRVLEKTPYARAFERVGAMEGSSVGVERVLQRSHAASCFNAFAGSPFNVGLAVAFLFLKSYELYDLFAIINGKASDAPKERVLDQLILRGL
jgi:vacuolar-type H+-ATPase subunit C/Vma6